MPRGKHLQYHAHNEQARARIQSSLIIKRLTDHINGDVELSPTQVTAAQILLRKVMPDLSTHHIDGQIEHRTAEPLSNANFDRWARTRIGNDNSRRSGADPKVAAN